MMDGCAQLFTEELFFQILEAGMDLSERWPLYMPRDLLAPGTHMSTQLHVSRTRATVDT